MTNALLVSEVQFKVAPRHDRKQGLLGWASFVVNGALKLDSVAVRRTTAGRVVLSFPARSDRAGRQHFFVRPLRSEVRATIERQVIRALRLEEGASQ